MKIKPFVIQKRKTGKLQLECKRMIKGCQCQDESGIGIF
jgi:hypothetical protein